MQNKRAVIWVAVSSEEQATPDKVSLQEQERLCRQWCEANGYAVLKVLTVPGYSRRESDIITAMEDFAAQGITAYHELRDLWQSHGVSVLVAYSHNRFGRSSTLHSHVVENTILSGAKIYLINGGWIDQSSFRSHLAIGGYMSAAEIDQFVQRRHAGLIEKARRGLPGGKPPMSHKVIRDINGKSVKLVVNEDARLYCEDAARLVIDGCGWDDIEDELVRSGHRQYRSPHVYSTFHSPWFWGHAVYGYRRLKNNRRGLWCFDSSIEAPEGVTLQYNTHEPMLTGDMADRVKAEMRRRTEFIKGRASPKHTGIFTGLMVCGSCGYQLSLIRSTVLKDDTPRYYGCTARHFSRKRDVSQCINKHYMRVESIQQSVTDMLLAPLIAGADLETLLTGNTDKDDTLKQIRAVEGEIMAVGGRVTELIRDKVRHRGLEEIYETEIQKEGTQLEALRQRLKALHSRAAMTPVTESQLRGVDELHRMGIEAFWLQDWTKINQALHRLLGDYQLVMLNKRILRFTVPEK